MMIADSTRPELRDLAQEALTQAEHPEIKTLTQDIITMQRTDTVSDARRVVTTQYGLNLAPHWDVAAQPSVDRFLVPGGPSTAVTNASLAAVEGRIDAPIVRLQGCIDHRSAP